VAAVDLGRGRTAMALVAGSVYTCAPLVAGSVMYCGNKCGGKLGRGNTDHFGDLKSDALRIVTHGLP